MTNDEFLSKYLFKELTEDVLAECEHFSCGVGDLDEYFQKDVLAYARRMVSRSYVFCPKECPQKIACAFSVSYDSLRITDLSNRKQDEFRELNDLSEKRLKRYPGILIGRLAVNQDYYEKNGFTYLFPSEEVESISTRKDKAIVPQNTRLMYFDLKDSTE